MLVPMSDLIVDARPVPSFGDGRRLGMPYCDNIHSKPLMFSKLWVVLLMVIKV